MHPLRLFIVSSFFHNFLYIYYIPKIIFLYVWCLWTTRFFRCHRFAAVRFQCAWPLVCIQHITTDDTTRDTPWSRSLGCQWGRVQKASRMNPRGTVRHHPVMVNERFSALPCPPARLWPLQQVPRLCMCINRNNTRQCDVY